HGQRALRIAELDQACVDAAGEQELCVLSAAVVIHAAARMTALLVARIQVVVFRRPRQFGHEGTQALVRAPGAALAAAGREAGGVDPHRDAGATVIAVRPIGKKPAAAKTLLDQLRIRPRVDQVPGGGHLRARLAPGQVAAWVRGSRVELQRREREFFKLAHSCPAHASGPGRQAYILALKRVSTTTATASRDAEFPGC